MKLSFIGLCVAGAVAILLQTGLTAQSSSALAQEGCIVTQVALHVKRCPAGVAYASTSSGGGAVSGGSVDIVEPTVTPTAGPPEGCIRTMVNLHVRRCPAGI